ncbi:MAG: Asp-tRNA(Asn)/Glu-tRNA(Gln) amidotransferase subunit GatB [Saprospiraceae bacterium]|nr:Asp-tRNA(Asn)/Glu-tRNA(Gln) amidotransferase subunit GatB [Saprospiraceae bacterium]
MSQQYETVVGLEIHVQLNTASKAFCRDRNHFGDEPNTNVSAISLALPGTLPMINRSQVISAIKLGVALDCEIDKSSSFDRKNYCYPDLPKGYQITQDAKPICIGGKFTFKTGETYKTINLHHIHMEEDAGKSIHDIHDDKTCLDYNRAGTPLLEVVTEPEFRSGQEVSDFINAFQILIRYLEISDANMEEGSLRCDCNVSVRSKGELKLGTRAEIKNVNSKKFAKQAIEFEAKRQWTILQKGGKVKQETRLFNTANGETYAMRKKEDALDYRYFPDPDLQTIILADQFIENIKLSIDHLPWEANSMLVNDYKVAKKTAETLSADKTLVQLFIYLNIKVDDATLVSNFIANQYISIDKTIQQDKLESTLNSFAEMLTLIKNKELSASTAYKQLIDFILKNPEANIRKEAENKQILINANDDNFEEACKEILNQFPDKVKAYKAGKKGLMGFFMGQFMKNGPKGINPKDVQECFEKLLTL